MNLQAAKEMALHYMQLHGVIAMGYRFEFNNRKNGAGLCSYTFKTIFLSKPLTELADEVDVKDTILHEIAHALCPGHGHDKVWRRKAIEIGCNGQRCYTNKDSLMLAHNLIAKYVAVCKNGHKRYRNRIPKHECSCGQCSRRYDPNNLLVFKPNV